MAQPIFEDHPLRDYLRQSGDVFDPIPGALSDLPDPFSEDHAEHPSNADLRLWSWLPAPILSLAEFLNIVVTSVQNCQSTRQEFSERFKYDVISSSLLSSSITSPSSTRRRSYSDDPPSHDPDLTARTASSPPPTGHPVTHRSSAWSLALVGLCLVSLSFDCFPLCIFIGTILYYMESSPVDSGHLTDLMTPTLDALNNLIAAAHLWDSTVQEAINLLEFEESVTPSLSPCSFLRVALHSSLQNTQAQSDNVRHVLVGLTSPSALAQLSEMYAPPSPVKPHTPLYSRSNITTASSHIRSISTPSENRTTWNSSMPYSYAALARAGSPTRQSLKRWEKRRSDISALLLRPSDMTMSAPVTPRPGKSLEGVEEGTCNVSEQEGDAEAVVVPPEERGQFASAALELQRQKRSRGIEAFITSTPLPHSAHITRLTSRASSSSPSSPRSSFHASRFTTMQVPRHPLSIHSLTLALNGALGARRYAASHLLALRFGGGDSQDDSESYWDDVRSVMVLLTAALANATAPLVEALDAGERERLGKENPTPPKEHSPSSERIAQPSSEPRLRQVQKASFAPLPSHLSRFAAHVDGLTNALNDARSHLESCVASLRDGCAADVPESFSDPREAPALQAYERLRRELGLALRECERGREPLLELLRAPSPVDDVDAEDDDEDGVPALGLDVESSDSERDAGHVRSPSPSSPTDALLVQEQNDDHMTQGHHHGHDVLVVGLERLPPPGIEQVFEADAGAVGPRPRPRSKLSRAERIAAAKERRANTLSGLGLSIVGDQTGGASGPDGERWGPGGDVVQELKDVIWKVGEQRRQREQQHQERQQRQRPQQLMVTTALAATQKSSDDVFTPPSS